MPGPGNNIHPTDYITTLNTQFTSKATYTLQTSSYTTQQNLSHKIMAETLAQANHCFSISPNTKINHPSTPKTKIVIFPEIVNVVICPETGKSLKHQELITTLKYKIKWMKSTANEINQL
jgi:hypothetical protein